MSFFIDGQEVIKISIRKLNKANGLHFKSVGSFCWCWYKKVHLRNWFEDEWQIRVQPKRHFVWHKVYKIRRKNPPLHFYCAVVLFKHIYFRQISDLTTVQKIIWNTFVYIISWKPRMSLTWSKKDVNTISLSIYFELWSQLWSVQILSGIYFTIFIASTRVT